MGNWLRKLFYGYAIPEPDLKKSKNSDIRESIQTGGPTGLARHLDIRRKSCKDEPINIGIAGRPNTETMEASHSQITQENNEDTKLKEIAKNKGISAVVKYIENNIDSWKKEPVKFGILGQTATGKSSFVNLVRNVKEGEEGYAKVGRGNTTTSPTPYVHPDNEQIVYVDLPGVGTLDFPKDNYINQMKLQDYDYFFIFFATVLHGEDAWFAEELVKMKKPFCLVKSKVDIDIEEGNEIGTDEKTVIKNLKEKTLHSITRSKYKELKSNSKLFCISCTKSGVGEIDKLLQHIKESLSSIKSEAVVYSLHTLSQKVIEEKYKSLSSRVFKISAGTALIAATPIPVIDGYINFKILVNEIKHYIQVFGLTSKQIRKVSYRDMKQLRCREFLGFRSEKRTVDMVTKMFVQKYLALIATLSISDMFLPIVGSIVSAGSTAAIVYKFLNEILENLHQDAIFVHDLILPVPVRIIRTLRLQFEKEGQEGMNRYILDVLNTWKEETVILGVIGEPNSGQIEFINLIRHLKICSSGYATESTTATPYYHPNNEGIIFIETGLSDFDVTNQLKSPNRMDLSSFDDFFVFLKGDIHTKDLQIFRDMDKIEKSFSVIRTKSSSMKPDQEIILGTGLSWLGMLDTDMELLVGEGEEIDSDMFRDIICTHMYEDYNNEYDIFPNVGALSLLNIGISEMDSLINHMIQNLPLAKTEAVMNALFPLSKVVIEEKFQSLKKRIVFVTTAAVSKSALQIPSFCFPVNMHILVDEVIHYIKVFRFSDKDAESCVITDAQSNKLRCKELLEPGVVFSDIINKQLKVLSTEDNIAENKNISDWFVPVAGSVVSSANNAAVVYKCLTRFLEDFRHDAFVVYDLVSAEN